MGYKKITFSSAIEKRTYVQGEFMGKYYGTVNDKLLLSKTELYDIHIYEGEISNLKNDKEHPDIVNETIFNAIKSETQLTQKSFENILVNLNTSIEDYDSIRIAIKEPKLEAVQIYDVVKDGNSTFGTLTCLVTGYLLEIQTKDDIMEIETCSNCEQVYEECTCNNISVPKTEINERDINEKGIITTFGSNFTDTFSARNRGLLKDDIVTTTPGCLGILGLILGLFFLFSLGLPGILIGLFLTFLYIRGTFRGILPSIPLHWKQLFYVFGGILLIGLFLNFINRPGAYNPWRESKFKTTETISEDQPTKPYQKINPNNNLGSQNNIQSTANYKTDNLNSDNLNYSDTSEGAIIQGKTEDYPLKQIITLYKDTLESFNAQYIQADSLFSLTTNRYTNLRPDSTLTNYKLKPNKQDYPFKTNQRNTLGQKNEQPLIHNSKQE
ncbi:hypothetical protein [uncultured Zobellia sp.]|uniref:hypothetical protein n=1 Tax=uncultured Zobellia sp. TaxID=255433 RepID=UPI0025951461|nr:hypothetical protein [uncultured Zobellia sp.]